MVGMMRLTFLVLLMLTLFVSPLLAQSREITAAEKQVRQQLREPSTARFLGMSLRTVPNMRGETVQVVCGKVSARTGFGGMSGAIPFVYLVASRNAYLAAPGITLEHSDLDPVVYGNFCS